MGARAKNPLENDSAVIWQGLLFLPALIAFLLVMAQTRHGLGLFPDSATYLGAAACMAEKRIPCVALPDGTSEILAKYPPLYPAVIAATKILAGSYWETALRLLHAALAFASVLFLQWLVGGSLRIRVLVGILAVFSSVHLYYYLGVYSEALFLPLVFLTLRMLREGELPESAAGMTSRYAIAGLTTCFALLTRYAGVFLIPLGISCLLLGPVKNRRDQRRCLLAYLGVSLGGAILWWVFLASHRSSARSFFFHPPGIEHAKMVGAEMLRWILPFQHIPTVLGILIAVYFLHWLLEVLRAPADKRQRKETLPQIWQRGFLPLAVALYSLTLVFTITLADYYVLFGEGRLLLPILPLAIVIFVEETTRLWPRASKAFRLGTSAFVVFFLLTQGGWTLFQYLTTQADGLGYRSKRWTHSETLQALGEIPKNVSLFSNAPDAIWLLLQRPSRMLPALYNPVTNQIGLTDSRSATALVRAGLIEGGTSGPRGRVVFFRGMQFRSYLPTAQDFLASGDFEVEADLADGQILRLKQAPPSGP